MERLDHDSMLRISADRHLGRFSGSRASALLWNLGSRLGPGLRAIFNNKHVAHPLPGLIGPLAYPASSLPWPFAWNFFTCLTLLI